MDGVGEMLLSEERVVGYIKIDVYDKVFNVEKWGKRNVWKERLYKEVKSWGMRMKFEKLRRWFNEMYIFNK